MASVFDEILSRAEKLSSSQAQSRLFAATGSEDFATQKPYVAEQMGADLAEIFRASESLWRRKRTRDGELQRALLFGERGVVLGGPPQLQKTAEAAPASIAVIEDDDIEETTARVRLEAERAFFNQVLLNRPHAAVHASRPHTGTALGAVGGGNSTTAGTPQRARCVVGPRNGDRRSAIFADRLRFYLRSDRKKDLTSLLNDAVRESNTEDITADIWSQVFAMMGKRCGAPRDDLQTSTELILRSTDYLHKSFVEHMSRCVELNLERAERGGIPGIRGLVAAYIKGCCEVDSQCEDAFVDGCPVWQVAYFCFRSGDFGSAANALKTLTNFNRSHKLVGALTYLASNERLGVEVKKDLKMEWRHEQNSIRDAYKRALYCALLGVDCSLADTMENWLWFKLVPLRVDPALTDALYWDVQKNISVDYGESYFMASGMSEAPLYFCALCLSGQFERAIDLLVQMGCLVDAVHVAILAKEHGLLRLTEPKIDAAHQQLLWAGDVARPWRATLSLARLLVTFTKSFEMHDVEMTLDYFYTLKGERTVQGRDIFESAVSRVVYLTSDVTGILGQLVNGKRAPGLIDSYDVDVNAVIAHVAEDTEVAGNMEMAINLLHVCGEDDRAVEAMSSVLSEALRSGDAERTRTAVARAEKLATEAVNASSDRLSTLCTLLDSQTLLVECQAGRSQNVLQVLRQVKLIPCDPEQVHTFTSQGHLVPKQVQTVLPDVCLAVMKCMVEGIDGARNAAERQAMNRQAQAIVMFAASSQYKFPQNIVSKILTLQVQIQ